MFELELQACHDAALPAGRVAHIVDGLLVFERLAAFTYAIEWKGAVEMAARRFVFEASIERAHLTRVNAPEGCREAEAWELLRNAVVSPDSFDADSYQEDGTSFDLRTDTE